MGENLGDEGSALRVSYARRRNKGLVARKQGSISLAVGGDRS